MSDQLNEAARLSHEKWLRHEREKLQRPYLCEGSDAMVRQACSLGRNGLAMTWARIDMLMAMALLMLALAILA